MIPTCKCGDDTSFQNYGTPDCIVGLTVPKHLIFLSPLKKDGTPNGIEVGVDTIDQTFFDARFKDQDPFNRWYMAKDVEGYESPLPDQKTFEYPSGRIIDLGDGIRSVVAQFPKKDPNKFKKKLDTRKCITDSMLIVDANGSLVGQVVDGFFVGRPIASQSFSSQVANQSDTTNGAVEIKWQWDVDLAKDGDVDYIVQESMGGYKLSQVVPLLDVRIVFVSATITEVAFDLELDYGGAADRTPAGGLDANIEIFNVTDDALEPTASVTESPDGRYIAVYTAPVTLADVIRVQGLADEDVQLGFDLKAIPAVTTITV